MPKIYASQVTLSFGPSTVTGNLTPVQNPSTPKFELITADYEKPSQVYQTEDGTIYKRGDLLKGIKDADGNYTLYNPEDIESAKESTLSPNLLSLNAHLTEEVDNNLFPSDHKAYIFVPVIKKDRKVIPNKVNDKWYDFLTTTIRENPDISLVGVGKIGRGNEALYRLGLYQGYILVQRMFYPEDLNQYEIIRPQVSPSEEKKASVIAHKLIQPFDVENYRNEGLRRLQAAMESEFDPATVQTIKDESVEDDFDLESVLDAWGD